MDEQVFRALLEEFYLESKERLDHIEQVLLAVEDAADERRAELMVEAKRELHTLKGNAGMMGLTELQELAHQVEDQVVELAPEAMGGATVRHLLDQVDQFRLLLERAAGREAGTALAAAAEDDAAPAVQESVRVSFAALDSLVDLLSEMVIFRNRLAEALAHGLGKLDKTERLQPWWREVEEAHQTLHRTLGDIQGGIMKLRMVPLGSLFAQLKRTVFDESESAGKQVHFEATGGETPLDKALLEVASEAMGHLIRNAIVHGIERPAERAAAGKPASGILSVAALAQAEEVVIDISDDGRGIDREGLLRAARRRGLELPEGVDLQTLMSLPGLSTQEQADKSAGRGMGMSAVMESVRRRGGQVEVFSAAGQGTRFRLRLPLTAAIVRALLIEVDGELYALPLLAVQETVRLQPTARHTMNQAAVVRWRGGLVPLLDIGLAFRTAGEQRNEGYIVIIEAEGKRRGLLIDAIAGIRDVVVKPLDEVTGITQGLAGCTILGDGRVVLILDATGLIILSPFLEQTA
ncbi:MAG TPA: chemotaxis protein CheW [Thermoanaerobaculia bacterium]|jgi:two-component system chemotaxis sensor kinase CheA|nr:chemotaxis protein CheW [Thermoanaerobaculia bacterium]